MINTTQDAIKICKNEITLIGSLDELLVDVTTHGDSAVVDYTGVVVVDSCYITFYGKITNSSNAFYQTIGCFNQLKAGVKSICIDGEDETEYSHNTSMVYMIGRLSTMNSIRATYIAPTSSNSYTFMENIVGVPIKIDDNVCKILIFNNHFHNIITAQLDNKDVLGMDILYKTTRFDIILHKYNDIGNPIFSVKPHGILDTDIDRNIIDNAIRSHDIYIRSLSK